MALTPEELARIAELARLQLDAEETARLARDCDAILEYFARIEEVADVPDRHSTSAESEAEAAPLRLDSPGHDPLDRPLAEIAPEWRDGFFLLPRLPALDADTPLEPPEGGGEDGGDGWDGGEPA